MGSYHGTGPDTDERKEQFPPGVHRVRIESFRRVESSGNWLVVLGNKHGEVGEFVPDDIKPYTREEKESIKARTGHYPDGYKFWRLVGGFDYPDHTYWSALPAEREPREWNIEACLREIQERGTEAVIKTSEWVDRKGKVRGQIDAVKSLIRHAEEIELAGDPGPGGSKLTPPPSPVATGGGIPDDEVPF